MQRNNGHFVNTDNVQSQVEITDGIYRNEPVQGTFLLVRDLKEGARGTYITVQMMENGDRLPNLPDDVDLNRVFRVKVDSDGYSYVQEQEETQEIDGVALYAAINRPDIETSAANAALAEQMDSRPKVGGKLMLATDYCQKQGLKYDSFRKSKTFQAMKVKGEDGRLYVQA